MSEIPNNLDGQESQTSNPGEDIEAHEKYEGREGLDKVLAGYELVAEDIERFMSKNTDPEGRRLAEALYFTSITEEIKHLKEWWIKERTHIKEVSISDVISSTFGTGLSHKIFRTLALIRCYLPEDPRVRQVAQSIEDLHKTLTEKVEGVGITIPALLQEVKQYPNRPVMEYDTDPALVRIQSVRTKVQEKLAAGDRGFAVDVVSVPFKLDLKGAEGKKEVVDFGGRLTVVNPSIWL